MSIELISRRGPVGKGWHAVALRDGAERLLGAARVGRGKADARAGRVQWLDIETGVARGDVRDADGELYQARLELPAFRDGDRGAFLQVARSRPELPARMAGGTYPQEIEAELARSEVSLLPRDASELSHDCSCLDWPGPCRHVAALLYVLVEAVDEKPVLLLTLRGLTLEDLVAPVTPPEPSGVEVATEEPDAPAPYDPSRTDPAKLVEVLGEDVAAVIHSFYAQPLQ
ncbi:MAG: SWIM zinc finger family protein [Brachybacterium sp.]